MRLRALNHAGLERFRAALVRLADDGRAEVPTRLLDDPDFTVETSVDLELEPRRHNSRLALGRYLNELLQPFPGSELELNRGLWAWLSLWLFDQVCPPGREGRRRPGRVYRHIPEFGFRYRHRHLLFGPYELYRRHGARAVVLLSGPPHVESGLYHEIASRRDLLANAGVIEAAVRLYMDRHTGGPKRGAQGSGVPGGVRRFVRVLQQLDLTYDIHGMSGRQLLELLPGEFDAWREL